MALTETLGIGIAVSLVSGSALLTASKGFSNIEKGLNKATNSATQLGFAMKRLGRGMSTSILSLARSTGDYIDMVAEVSRGSFMIQKTTELSSKQMRILDSDIKNLSSTMATSQTQIQSYAERAGTAGIAGELIESSKAFEMVDQALSKFNVNIDLSEKAMSAAKGQIKEVTEFLVKLGKVSDIQSEAQTDRFFKAALQFANEGESQTDAVKKFGDQILTLEQALPATANELVTLSTKLINLKGITNATREDLLVLAGGISFVAEQSRTSANNILDVFTELMDGADNAVKIFDSLRDRFKTGDELRDALKDPQQGFKILIDVVNEYADALNRTNMTSTDAKMKLIDIERGFRSLFSSNVSSRIALNVSEVNDKMGFLRGLLEGPMARAFDAVARKWEEYTKTSDFAIQQQKVNFENLKIEIGAKLLPIWLELSQMVLQFASSVRKLMADNPKIMEFVRQWGAAAVAIGVVGGKIIDLGGSIVLVLSGLSRILGIVKSPALIALFGLPAVLAAAFFTLGTNWEGFSGVASKFFKDLAGPFKSALGEVKELLFAIGNAIKKAFSSDEAKAWAGIITEGLKTALKIAIDIAGVLAEGAKNLITGENDIDAKKRLARTGVDTSVSVLQNKDFQNFMRQDMPTIDFIGDQSKGWSDAFWESMWQVLGFITEKLLNGVSAVAGFAVGKIGGFVEYLFQELAIFTYKAIDGTVEFIKQNFLGIIEFFVNAALPGIGVAATTYVNSMAGLLTDVKNAISTSFSSIGNSFTDIASRFKEWVNGWIDWLFSNEAEGQPQQDIFPQETQRHRTDHHLSNWNLGDTNQTGRIIKKPTKMGSFLRGETGAEAIVPLDQDSRTRAIRGSMSQAQTIVVTPTVAQIVLDGKVIGQAAINFMVNENEKHYGFTPTPATGVG